MAAIKTDSNQEEILSNGELIKRLNHLDEGIHAIQRQLNEISGFIDEHKPALARGLSLMDPGAKLRAAVGLKPKARS